MRKDRKVSEYSSWWRDKGTSRHPGLRQTSLRQPSLRQPGLRLPGLKQFSMRQFAMRQSATMTIRHQDNLPAISNQITNFHCGDYATMAILSTPNGTIILPCPHVEILPVDLVMEQFLLWLVLFHLITLALLLSQWTSVLV